MNFEEFTWFNQQLAAMLREGLPLAGALKQLTESQRHGLLRDEFVRLEAALASGIPLEQSIAASRLPPLYIRLVQAGVRSGDLAGALTMAADHYSDLNSVWRRAKALLLYPALVIILGFALSLLLWKLHQTTTATFAELLDHRTIAGTQLGLAFVPLVFAVLGATFALLLCVPPFRQWLLWRMPGFREARTANLAGGLALMLKHGCPLPEALSLMQELERDSPAEGDLALWQHQLKQGEASVTATPGDWRAVPAMLAWFIRTAGSDLAEGFRRAAQFYRERANHRLDLLLHGALPLLLVLLGLVIGSQVMVIFRMLTPLIDGLGGAE